ncbi:MAG: helix-turn-helix domain-containing protein [Candidatus Dormibacteria bacterium]
MITSISPFGSWGKAPHWRRNVFPHDATPTARLRLLVSISEAAAALGLSHRSVRSLVYAGKLRSCKVGARRLIAVEDLESFVRSLRECQPQ